MEVISVSARKSRVTVRYRHLKCGKNLPRSVRSLGEELCCCEHTRYSTHASHVTDAPFVAKKYEITWTITSILVTLDSVIKHSQNPGILVEWHRTPAPAPLPGLLFAS